MNQGLTRQVRHPLGLTDRFDVERGVAQGAVESPWVYTAFLDALARALKAAGLGVWVAGVQVPLLMYADDMIMLARSQAELARMNEIVTAFAKQNRFQFNGEKSAVMAFNEDREILEAVHLGMKFKTSPNLNLGLDAGSVHYRKLLDKAISAEQTA